MIRNIPALIEQARGIRKAIADTIRKLPDNKKINRINDKCFTMNVSKLSDKMILSPEYYDFKYQYELIADVLEGIPIERTMEWLFTITGKGSFVWEGNTVKLNPEVIQYIKGLL